MAESDDTSEHKAITATWDFAPIRRGGRPPPARTARQVPPLPWREQILHIGGQLQTASLGVSDSTALAHNVRRGPGRQTTVSK